MMIFVFLFSSYRNKITMYARLYQQCLPSAPAQVSNTKYLIPDIVPYIRSDAGVRPSIETGARASSDPREWGPHLWSYLHYSAANYPQKPCAEVANRMKSWLTSLPVTIPCKNCSKHYQEYLEKHRNELDKIVSSRDNLFAFLVNIHNIVNRRNGKPIMSQEEARQLYGVRN